MTNKALLEIADYVVVGIMLLIPLGIGILFAVKDSKRATRDEYLLGGRRMTLLPVTLSLFATYSSAISLMGSPTDVYTYGGMFVTLHLGFSLSYIIGYFTMIPLFYPLHLTSVYEYLDLRFESSLVRFSCVVIGMLQTICYMAIALLTPALALQAAAGFPLWMSVAIVGVIGTIYTAMGGIKSVLWTDAFQTLLMFSGVIMIILKGSITAGGASSTLSIAKAGGRIDFNEFNPDPRIRHSWWGTIIGGNFMWMVNVFNQSTIQRICSLRTYKDAKRSLFLNIPILIVYGILLLACGISIYAYFMYLRCDPYEAGLITNRSQLPPYFVLHAMKDIPGIAGFYLGALFSGALSTISSGINALAAITVEDFLGRPLQRVTESTATLITKLFVCVYGALMIGLAYAANSLKGPVTQMALSIFGACGGPLVGVFCLGGSVPWGNKYGAVTGLFVALSVNMWIALGGQIYGRKHHLLPHPPTDMCFSNVSTLPTAIPESTSLFSNLTFTEPEISPVFDTVTNDSDTRDPYAFGFFFNDISYEWYGFIGAVVSFTVGLVVSYFTRTYVTSTPNSKLFFPFTRKLWSLPEPVRTEVDEDNLQAAKNLQESKVKLQEFQRKTMSLEIKEN